MPWCPRCDETFPQGPACPRCSARLVAREHQPIEDPLQTVPGLKGIKVSRRYLRALDRLSGPRASGSRALALALVLLVFASGFLLGRVGGVGPIGPTVRSLAATEPVLLDEVNGDVISYVMMTRDPLVTIAEHDVYAGEVLPLTQFSPPFDRDERVTSRVVSFGRSVAVVVTSDAASYVAFAPHTGPAQGWVRGIEVAWQSEWELLIRKVDGSIEKRTVGDRDDVTTLGQEADQLLQTTNGPVFRRGNVLSAGKRTLKLPKAQQPLAVSADLTRALLPGPVLWDGKSKVEMRTGSGDVLGATFDRPSERVAVTLRGPDGLAVAIVDRDGNTQLKPIPSGDGCEGPPVWDASGEWVYVADRDGTIHVVEASGGRTRSVRTEGLGCGVAWIDAT